MLLLLIVTVAEMYKLRGVRGLNRGCSPDVLAEEVVRSKKTVRGPRQSAGVVIALDGNKGVYGKEAVTALLSVCVSALRLCVALYYIRSRPVDSSTTLLAE